MNARLKSFFYEHGFALLAPLVALFLVGALQTTGWLQQLEDLTINLRFQLRAPWDPPADSRLLLVGIDQQSLALFGRWPWPRTVEADFLKLIAESDMNPKTIAFDLLLVDNANQYHDLGEANSNMDTMLGDAAGLLPSVITGAQGFGIERSGSAAVPGITVQVIKDPGPTQPFDHVVGDRQKIIGSLEPLLPVEPLRKQSLFGFVDDTPGSSDNGVRYRLPMLIRAGQAVYPSLSLQTLCQILHVDADKVTVDVGHHIVLRNSSGKTWTIPINEHGEMKINYRNSAGFRGVNFGYLFQSLTAHVRKVNPLPIPPECNIDQKALLIGHVADGYDIGPTPLTGASPLVYTHFNAINDVLRGDYVRTCRWPWIVAFYLAVTWLSLLGLRNASITAGVAIPTAVIVFYAVLAIALFWVWSIEIPMVWPVVAYYGVQVMRTIRLWLAEARGRERIKTVFSRMLSAEVMNHVLEHPSGLELGGTMREVTVLFSDIRDYTKISEGIQTDELVRQLNTYFGEMVDCVLMNQGTLHKFIGDAIMAVWGDIAAASRGPEADARAALDAALEMRHRLAKLNVTRTAAGLLPLRIGIGLNHGDVLAGQIGAAQRSEFTVIGDPVNAASRLEGMTKEFHTDLAVGQGVASLIGDDYILRKLGLVQLKGKTEPLMVFEVFGKKNEPTRWRLDDLYLYHEAFEQFLARNFTKAEAGFSECLKRYPEDYCLKRYCLAVQDYRSAPPAEDWDGRIVMETK